MQTSQVAAQPSPIFRPKSASFNSFGALKRQHQNKSKKSLSTAVSQQKMSFGSNARLFANRNAQYAVSRASLAFSQSI